MDIRGKAEALSPPGRSLADTEPAHRAEGVESAGSVVVLDVDLSADDGLALQSLRESLSWIAERHGPGDAMHWSPPTGGEEIPPCPA